MSNGVQKKKLTYSQVCDFRNCRRLWYWRNVEAIEPRAISQPLHFGGIVHWGLEQWFNGMAAAEIFDKVQARFEAEEERISLFGRSYDLYVIAALEGYFRKYPRKYDPWEVVSVEQEWESPLVNPDSGRSARKLHLGGKLDLLVKHEGEYWLVEHKTVSKISASAYRRDRLWSNFQAAWYIEHASRALGIEIVGVIFDIIQKSDLRRRGMNPTGKTKLEPRDAFLARLLEDHAKEERYERTHITYNPSRILQMNREVWALKNQMLEAAQAGDPAYYQNPDFCFKYNGACRFYKLCSSDFSPVVRQNHYIESSPNQELTART
tara:strand:+ start:2347 stop:3309 length:963 start_codon:yes stop_codon:yes gene_type:complete